MQLVRSPFWRDRDRLSKYKPSMVMVFARLMGAALLMLAPSAAAAEPLSTDLFTGTLSVDQGKPVLTRCDAVGNRYALIDSRVGANHPLSDYAQSDGDVFDVIGVADQSGRATTLTVRTIKKRVPRPLCHLDEIESMSGPAPKSGTNQ